VRFDRGSRALYATDASNYRQVPIGLVIPRDGADVVAAVAACRKFGAPVLSRGAGTSLAGQCCNVAVVLDFTKYMNQVLELDVERRFARVQPGTVLDTLQRRAKPHGLMFAPDPSTHSRCSIGGMIGNNSCGTHSLLGGKTVDNVEELKVVLYDGTELTVGATSDSELASIIRAGGRRGELYGKLKSIREANLDRIRQGFPQIPRRVSGYNLDELLPERGFHVARSLVGSEGTCVVILEAKIRLIKDPPQRSLVALGFDNAFIAADRVPEILQLQPIGLEGIEGSIVEGLRRKQTPHMDLLPDGRGFLLVEFGAEDAEECRQRAEQLVAAMRKLPKAPGARIYNAAESKFIWQIREAGPRASAFAPGVPAEWEGWDDAAVPPEKLGGYLRDIRKLLDEYSYRGSFYGHFGHGCIHMRVSFDLESETGVRNYGEFVNRAADLVVSYGGSLSGEHGDGQSRGALLPKMYGPELMQAFREFKSAWDPTGRMNPGKLIDAYLPTENLRLGADYKPWAPLTHFQFPADDGSLAKATLRCLGIGACRKLEGGTMCPSYLATSEEEHSTRGRAHMLFEMLQGEVVSRSWQDEHVKRSLDLCLSCKACKTECPANVDMATWKAEFLSHYYEGKSRPLGAYAFGWVDRWALAASRAPGIANSLAASGFGASVSRKLLGIARERKLPRLASQTFQHWARGQRIGGLNSIASDAQQGCQVVLWADTFNNFFRPETAIAATQVLQSAGFEVFVPQQHLCCGRPLYDFGMLDRAKRYLQRILSALAGVIDTGMPVIVLEPSCASVFRDELTNLFPRDDRAQRLKAQTFLFSEFLQRRAPNWQPPQLSRRVLVHGHCHHKSLMKTTDEEELLRRMGVELSAPDTGCCGMAGPFGFEQEKYAISQKIGERVLLPAVRAANQETLIVSDGFSCREQIEQATGRKTLHLAEVCGMGLGRG
jgi:FAD/FMN-containing dehydrogenase/Fe-S oxidoreductase